MVIALQTIAHTRNYNIMPLILYSKYLCCCYALNFDSLEMGSIIMCKGKQVTVYFSSKQLQLLLFYTGVYIQISKL